MSSRGVDTLTCSTAVPGEPSRIRLHRGRGPAADRDGIAGHAARPMRESGGPTADPGHCGACNRCCKTLYVDDHLARLRKPRGVWCAHARRGKGCAIYSTRPLACMEYECFWLASQKGRGGERGKLPGALRPDRCGAVLEENMHGETVVWMDAERPDAIESGALKRFVDAEVDRGRVVVARVGDDVRAIGHEEAVLAFDARVRRWETSLPQRLVIRPRRSRGAVG